MGEIRAVPPRKVCYQAPSAQRSLEEGDCLRQLGPLATQLAAAKVSKSGFRGKVRKFLRHFKGHCSIGNVQVRILPGQPGSAALGETVPDTRKKARQWRLLRIGHQSPDSDFGHSRSELANSLRQTFEKLPFLGDCGRRPVSIRTAWRSAQCNRYRPAICCREIRNYKRTVGTVFMLSSLAASTRPCPAMI